MCCSTDSGHPLHFAEAMSLLVSLPHGSSAPGQPPHSAFSPPPHPASHCGQPCTPPLPLAALTHGQSLLMHTSWGIFLSLPPPGWGRGETVAQLIKRLPKDAAAAFIYSQLLSWPLTHTHVRTFLWRYLRSSLTNLSLILLELSFCPNKAPKLSLTLAYTLTLSSPNIPSSDIKPGIFWWATTGLP